MTQTKKDKVEELKTEHQQIVERIAGRNQKIRELQNQNSEDLVALNGIFLSVNFIRDIED